MNHKRLFIILSVAFVALCGFVLFTVFHQQQFAPASLPTHNAALKNSSSTVSKSTDLSQEYLNSGLRIIGVFQNTKQPVNISDYKLVNTVQLVVATERAQTRGDSRENDSQCGSIYTQPTCYFFIEPLYIHGAPDPKFIGKLEGPGAFDPKSVVFTEPDIVEFNTADGDGPAGFTAHWRMNLSTGEIKQLSRKEN